MNNKRYTLVLALLISCSVIFAKMPKREMRAVWIATVANIDWPSRMGLSPRQQQAEMIDMLNRLEKERINTIIIQIRPTADSFYPSQLEPWSMYLSGVQGSVPHPYYDPLQFVIKEAHKRCMEVHGWINPYRVTNDPNHIKGLDKGHLFHTQKELFVEYGGKYYFDPGKDQTRAFLNRVVQDIVMRYDVDALHFDDYFYPYPIGREEFPDQETFRKHPRGFLSHEKADWRRNNVNMIIAELQHTIKQLKPWIQFGVSPFGVWRNSYADYRGSKTRAGITNYDDLYADILKWLKEGTIDYVVPQLYWEIGKKVADYKTLVKWWSDNSYNRNLYIGLYASGLLINRTRAWRYGNQLAKQLKLNQHYPKIEGTVFFSAKPFLKNPKGLLDTLQNNYYRYPALHPTCKNIRGTIPPQPQHIRIIKDYDDSLLLWERINTKGGDKIAYYVIYQFKGKKVGDLTDPRNILGITTDNYFLLNNFKLKGHNTFVVTAVNRFKNESIPTQGISRKL